MNKFSNLIRPNRNQKDLVKESQIFRATKTTLSEFTPKILYHSPNYCIINKPYDVRMDGDFAVTVDKLVAQWLQTQTDKLKWIHQLDFATSGVLAIGLNREATAAASSAFYHRLPEKTYLAVLQGHLSYDNWPECQEPFNKMDFIDHTHRKRNKRKMKDLWKENKENKQLDETNGWQNEIMQHNLRLCLSALEEIKETEGEEHIRKTIEAEGNSDLKNVLSFGYEQLSISAKRRKQLRKVLALYNKAPVLLESTLGVYEEFFQKKKENNGEGDNKDEEEGEGDNLSEQEEVEEDNDNDLNNAETATTAQEEEQETNDLETELINLCKDAANEEEFFATDNYLKDRCSYYLTHNTPQDISIGRNTPFIYRYRDSSTDTDKLMIRIPLTEKENEFRMEPSPPELFSDPSRSKVAATEVIILDNRAFYGGQPVTKVLFRPLTGRRHQLRIHSLCLGHPIVGDFTYNRFYREQLFHYFREHLSGSVGDDPTIVIRKSKETIQEELEKIVCERMMLHAFSLKIPFAAELKCSERFKEQINKEMKERFQDNDKEKEISGSDEDRDKYLIDVTSQDPFPVLNGVLIPETN
jgi:23S rRNA-/tRNA-specific pseudouridylate synthase